MQRLSAFEYRYLTEFQSHEPEFDYLKSLEIEEKINQVSIYSNDWPVCCLISDSPLQARIVTLVINSQVRWCQSSNGTRMLLSTNDKTIKLWKVRYSSFIDYYSHRLLM